jgi:TctA family transporter
MIPYKYLYPSAMFFVCIGVYSTNNDMFQVGEVLIIGIAGYILNMLGFHPAPILLGFVLGPRFEENFRRALLISRGDLLVFLQRPISAVFVTLCVLLILGQIYVRLRKPKANGDSLVPADLLAAAQSPHPGTAHAPQGVPAPQPAAE